MTKPRPMVTISVRLSFVQINGVAQPEARRESRSVRLTVQISLPVFASSATKNDSPSLSCSW